MDGRVKGIARGPVGGARPAHDEPKSMRNSTIRVATFAGPGAEPIIRSVPWPQVPKNAALIQIGACGVGGTDPHILKGHWPKPVALPFTPGHELRRLVVAPGGA